LKGFVVPTEIRPLLLLLDAAKESVASHGGGPVCEACLYPGSEISLDYCGPGSCGCKDADGMLMLQVNSVYMYTSFGRSMEGEATQCGTSMAASCTLGVMRCVDGIGDQGDLPSCELLLDASMRQFADMRAMLRAMTCTPGIEVLVGRYTSEGPDGGCVGGSWTFDIALEEGLP